MMVAARDFGCGQPKRATAGGPAVARSFFASQQLLLEGMQHPDLPAQLRDGDFGRVPFA
jgi:hypothetical protein